MTLNEILSRFETPKKAGNDWQVKCPAHDDNKPSLYIKETEDGKILLCCQAGCETDSILATVNLKRSDLFPSREPATKRNSSKKVVAVYPYHDEAGKLLFEAIRYDPKGFSQRRPDGNGKYIYNLTDVRRVPYRLPELIEAVRNGETVFIVEGEKDVNRLYDLGFTATCNNGGADKWRSEYSEVLRGANCVLIPDNDLPGRKHMETVAKSLQSVGATVRSLELPGLPEKGDVSDWLNAGNPEAQLRSLAEACPTVVLPAHIEPETPEGVQAGEYLETSGGLWHVKETRDGMTRKLLTNFTARIVSQTIEDDGAETSLLLTLEATRQGRKRQFSVTASGFSTMNWVIENLGAGAIIYPGQTVREHTRTAIQMLSGDIPTEDLYRHTGWRDIEDGKWAYLHGGGAIGAEGVSVKLEGSLSRYALPPVPQGEELRAAVAATLNLLSLAPPEVMCPLFASIWRASLDRCDFSLFLSGLTGVFKSELAALAQGFFGSEFTGRTLPADWSSTDNALETLAFCAKDTLFTIDEYVPRGGASEVQKLRAKADRVLRAQGNGASRQRLRADGTPRPPKPPRGLIVCTGEDLPAGQSLQARMIALEIKPGDIPLDKLTECQKDRDKGLYAACMAAFLAWVAPQYETVRKTLLRDVPANRDLFTGKGHFRSPETLAHLYGGLKLFTRFLIEKGFKTEAEAAHWLQAGRVTLLKVSEAQARAQTQHDPSRRFLELLRESLSSGRVHLANESGGCPEDRDRALHCGWRLEEGIAGYAGVWKPQGKRVGFLVGENVYLFPELAYTAAKEAGDAGGEGINLSPSALWRRLKEKNVLITEESRQTNTVRKRIGGENVKVLHITYTPTLSDSTDKTDNADNEQIPESENE